MSSALINDYPITFLPHLAKAIGVNEALVLQQLHYWLVNHAEMQHDGKFWIYKTYEEWQEQDFFFWSVRTVKSIFKKLGDMGLIESQKLSSNRHNRVNYYTINSVKLAEISAICEAEFEAKRLAKLAKKGGKPCTVDSANLAQSQSADSAQSQGANPAQCLREQEENNKDNKEEAQPQNSEIDLSLTENLNAIEVFEFLKKSSVFGSELGIIQHREPNISELNVLIAEVTGYWSGKYLSKQQLLTKILSSVSRKNAQSRIDTYTMPKQQATTDAPVINTNRVSVSPFAKFLGDNV